jgi:hypothetical protein
MRVLFGKALWVWVVFFLLAVVNGFLREAVYLPTWGELWGRLAGTGILLLAMLLVTYVFLRGNVALLTRPRLVLLGLLWLGLSLFFELAVSHWVMEQPWETILAPYNLLAARLRVLVRLAELLGPIALGGRLLRAREPYPVAVDEAQPPTATE